ncbi:hypothetical protein AB0H71_33670 [Nocardia sp. NPDC050697]|uniref:hypothetical protein n=1 Tax=Nocardia sp. NPDC050697 TaxID=3155158 RepID=UPI0033EF93D7
MTRPPRPEDTGTTAAKKPSATRAAMSKAISAGGRPSEEPAPRRRRLLNPGPPGAESQVDERPALQRRSQTKRQQGINFDILLLEYARDAVALMGRRHPEEAGSESLAALVDQALREKLDKWERKYNDGKALPPL